MKTATTGAQVTIRASGVLLIILGVTFWTGHALQLIPLHEFLGLLLVLSLWTLAGIAGTLWALRRTGSWSAAGTGRSKSCTS